MRTDNYDERAITDSNDLPSSDQQGLQGGYTDAVICTHKFRLTGVLESMPPQMLMRCEICDATKIMWPTEYRAYTGDTRYVEYEEPAILPITPAAAPTLRERATAARQEALAAAAAEKQRQADEHEQTWLGYLEAAITRLDWFPDYEDWVFRQSDGTRTHFALVDDMLFGLPYGNSRYLSLYSLCDRCHQPFVVDSDRTVTDLATLGALLELVPAAQTEHYNKWCPNTTRTEEYIYYDANGNAMS